ncbi:ribosomal-protein-serine acetyltransferase [Bacillus ectoiniformans]|uniref:GNAT family N-acetyltransferase n=1 Tax=Bacillus ectoiniformans TaxID=1494429 RepID=UPI00195A0A9B|nr:GNAT family protein [Bacillus ectoiniformans]MBM7648529.1 ribosomal-protein-serine acetyltransferase [Bacillus ectoiniformans]
MFIHKIDQETSLKLIEYKDADSLFALTDESRQYLREWLPWIDATKTAEDTKAFIQSSLKGYADNKSLTTIILDKDEVAGVAGFNTLDWANQSAAIGYWLGEGFQGKGIMTKAVKALVDYAFEEMGLNRVEIRAAVENVKSRSIPERLNFKEEGILRQSERLYGRYVDHVVYSMLAEEWK